MRLKLPHREVVLDSDLTYPERNELIKKLLSEKYNEDLTVEEYFQETWNIQHTIICMDMIGYYLSKGNVPLNDDGTKPQDDEVLSHKKQKEIEQGTRKYSNFSNLSLTDKVSLGLDTDNDYI